MAQPGQVQYVTGGDAPPQPGGVAFVQYGGPQIEGQPVQYYAAPPGGPGGAPPPYSAMAGMPAAPQLTPIAQSPQIMVQAQPYYANQYGQMAAPVVYSQPYGQPVMAQPVAMAGGVNAIPVQVAVAVPPAGVVTQSNGLWSDGIWDCCNPPQQFWWCAFFFPWLQWADNVHRARLMDKCTALILFGICWILFWVGFGVFYWAFFVGWVFMLILGATYRGKIRQKYGVHGSECDDCVMHCFCIPCAISQEGRHIWNREGQPPV